MQVQVTRKLQYHRPSDSTTEPVNEIDQMFVVGISNVFGVEAWNSYSTPFLRNLKMVVLPDISVQVTNLDSTTITPQWSYAPAATILYTNNWPAYAPWQEQYSFVTPLGNGNVPYTNHVFLTNSTYKRALDQFVPLTGSFERPGGTNFYVPHWQLQLKTRLRFAMVDTSANRIVDYVSLAADNPLDITDALTRETPETYSCDPGSGYSSGASNGSMWCTNRMNGATTDNVPTFGILNQIEASMGRTSPDWNSSTHEFPPGMDKNAAISFFKNQFMPWYSYASNTFNAPFQPFRNIYLVTDWQANDPLVHYMLSDLVDPARTTLVLDKFSPAAPRPTDNLGRINSRYEPWGGNPRGYSLSQTAYDLTVKDPFISDPDYWDFPTNPLPNLT